MSETSPLPAAPRRAYLDHAATTPMRVEAREALVAHLDLVGNPSSLHAAGREARRVVEESRETVADALGCRPGEVVLTAGGTESDNLALKGLFWSRRAADPRRVRVLVSAVEHHAVLDTAVWLAEHEGATLELLPVDARGRLDVAALEATLVADPTSVALVSVMWANNETGVLQPVEAVVAAAHAHGVPVHTDAIQAVGSVPVDVAASGVDLLTATAHKVGGPHGAGVLVARRGLDLTPLLHGGGQERDLRSGTVGVPAVAGLAAAFESAVKEQVDHATRVSHLRDTLVEGVRAVVPDVVLNGGDAEKLPGIANLRFPECEGDSLLMLLDAQGVEVSTGSACSAGVPQASHVLLAMGQSEEEARSSLRFSLGHTSTEADVAALVAAIGPVVERARTATRRVRR
ncbi:cysteine desulfurase family protein [Nocardioides alkalitolerans]|uniref:cysteine desulfurase family protein n=1 Tax=Nocardioides alkalitolerans TaxID=281714 RepID=UPI00040DAC9C|nr:cysteine desulfurase family protein [Nocardioides alkalitolerans]